MEWIRIKTTKNKHPDMYMEIVKEYQLAEEANKNSKEEEMLKEGKTETEEEDLKFVERDIFAIPSKARENRIKATTRNLRIVEDTAKYLFNLDDNSAKYDPKSRSMNDDPNPDQPNSKQIFRGDRMAKFTGDAPKLVEQEKFVWEMVKKTNADLNSVANPTVTEKTFQKIKESTQTFLNEKNEAFMDNYGSGIETMKSNNPDYLLLVGQNEGYQEYNKDGKVMDRWAAEIVKSKYEEDVYPKNHTTVYGSWWSKIMGWGFACCHTYEKEGDCEGDIGKKKNLAKEFKMLKAMENKKDSNSEKTEKRKRSRSFD